MINPKIQFTRIRDVKAPNRKNLNDAGMDIFVPNFSDSFLSDLCKENKDNGIAISSYDGKIEMTVYPQHKVVIPMGIKFNILDKNTYLDASNKGGVATGKGLVYLAHVIDADYRGEVFVSMVNTSTVPAIIKDGDKLIQLIHKEYIKSELEEISNEAYDALEETDRGEGKRGSTGTV